MRHVITGALILLATFPQIVSARDLNATNGTLNESELIILIADQYRDACPNSEDLLNNLRHVFTTATQIREYAAPDSYNGRLLDEAMGILKPCIESE